MPSIAPAAHLPGRLAPDRVWPAGQAGHAVRWLTLGGGERVRAVVCDPPAAPAAPAGAPPGGVPTAVFVHGWGCSAYSFRHVLRPVADAGARAVALDLRGHGWSDKPLDARRYEPASLARWLLDAFDALGLARATLVGHSLGGMVALRAAADAPARVAALALVAPLGLSPVRRLRALRWLTPAVLDGVLPRLATRATVARALAMSYGRHGAPTPRDVDEYWAPTADPALARATRLVAHASDWGPLPPADLARVRCPTRVLLGDRDNLIRVEPVRRLVASLPDGRLEVIAGAGHVPAEETPERVVGAVVALLLAAS